MRASDDRFALLQPKLLRRLTGGWLAVSDGDAFLKIGVEGSTEEEAVANFIAAVERWRRSLDVPE